MFLFFILQLFFLIWRMCFFCLIIMFFVFFLSIFSFLFCAVGFPITSQNAKEKTRKIQNPDQKASKRVCPTSVSVRASAQQLRPQRLKHWNPLLPFSLMCCTVVCPMFFLVIKAAVFYMEFWFMTGLPQESRQVFVFANSPAQWAKCQAGNHPKSVQSLAHKRFVSQKSGTQTNWWEIFRESFVYVYNCGVGCTCHERNIKKN